MTRLLDSSVLIAASFEDHVHHAPAVSWLDDLDDSYATCPMTQGALVRAALRAGFSASDSAVLLGHVTAGGRHEFWPDDPPYTDVPLRGVLGHRQVTDAYLAELARRRRSRIATLDRGFAALHADVAELVPTA